MVCRFPDTIHPLILTSIRSEPTSALDIQSSLAIEQYLTDAVRLRDKGLTALIWISHSIEQGGRVGTRFLRLADGTIHEDAIDSGV